MKIQIDLEIDSDILKTEIEALIHAHFKTDAGRDQLKRNLDSYIIREAIQKTVGVIVGEYIKAREETILNGIDEEQLIKLAVTSATVLLSEKISGMRDSRM